MTKWNRKAAVALLEAAGLSHSKMTRGDVVVDVWMRWEPFAMVELVPGCKGEASQSLVLISTDDLSAFLQAQATPPAGKPAVLPELPPEVQRELDYMGLRVTQEMMTVPKWWMDYLADSSRHSHLIYDYIRAAYPAAKTQPVDDTWRQLTPEDTIAELERREREGDS